MIEQRLLTPMNRLALAALAFLVTALVPAWGQIEDPVTWSSACTRAKRLACTTSCFTQVSTRAGTFTASIWTTPTGHCPPGSAWNCRKAQGQGDVQECEEPIVEYDPNFMMDLKYFEEEVLVANGRLVWRIAQRLHSRVLELHGVRRASMLAP